MKTKFLRVEKLHTPLYNRAYYKVDVPELDCSFSGPDTSFLARAVHEAYKKSKLHRDVWAEDCTTLLVYEQED